MAKEIERKFLVSSGHWRNDADAGTDLRQAYVVTMEDRSVRVRILSGERAKLTVKIGKSALVRDEFEYDLPLADALDLLSQAVGRVIEKTRYRVPVGDFLWEIDVYRGELSGLVVAEVEMASVDDDPALPFWIGREVTGDRRYSNQFLALDGMPRA
jgi:CYTH domain-containing protein